MSAWFHADIEILAVIAEWRLEALIRIMMVG